MAIDSIIRSNTAQPDAPLVQPVGSLSLCAQVCTDAEVAAASAAELLAPFSYSTAGASRWVRRGAGIVRAYFYARMVASATVTTDPVIRIYGAIPVTDAVADAAMKTPLTGAIPNDGTWRAIRLDNADWNTAGLTLDLISSGAGLNNDATYAYSDETDEIDLQDCWYYTALVETAANVNTGTVPIFARELA